MSSSLPPSLSILLPLLFLRLQPLLLLLVLLLVLFLPHHITLQKRRKRRRLLLPFLPPSLPPSLLPQQGRGFRASEGRQTPSLLTGGSALEEGTKEGDGQLGGGEREGGREGREEDM